MNFGKHVCHFYLDASFDSTHHLRYTNLDSRESRSDTMEEREMTFTLSEDLYRTLQQRQGDDLGAFVRQAVVEKLADLDPSGSVGGEKQMPSPLLEKFTQGLEGKDVDQLIREARVESENRIIGQGVAFLALFISEIMMEAIIAPASEREPGSFPTFFSRRKVMPAA
jgi:hypothetical protein